jgi:hypothetical protein
MAQDKYGVSDCDECGRLIVVNMGMELCPECFVRQLEAYQRIEKVLAVMPDISPSELAKRARVSRSVITRLVKKKRIKLRSDDKPVHCHRCGAPMDEVGKFCEPCRAELMFQVKDAAATVQKKLSGRVHMRGRAHGVVRALTRKRSLFRGTEFGTKGKYSP